MTNKVLNLDFSKDPIMMPAIIYGRVGDDNSQTVTVNVTKRNEIFDLTGGSLTFEGVTKGGTTQVFDSDNISTTAEGLKKVRSIIHFPMLLLQSKESMNERIFHLSKMVKEILHPALKLLFLEMQILMRKKQKRL